MSSSILNDVKKVLGLEASYTDFDLDVMIHVNSAFATLNQLGIGPDIGFMIEDNTATWDAFFTDPRMNSIKTYVYLRTRMLFDPPSTAVLTEAWTKQIEEFEVRLNTLREGTAWTDPTPPSTVPTWSEWC